MHKSFVLILQRLRFLRQVRYLQRLVIHVGEGDAQTSGNQIEGSTPNAVANNIGREGNGEITEFR